MLKNARGRKPNQLNQLTQYFANKSKKEINPEKFADDRSGSLLLKILKPKHWDFIPREIHESLLMALSQTKTKDKIKAMTKIVSTCAGLWSEISVYYKSKPGFQNRLLTDLKLKYTGCENMKETIIDDLYNSLFLQLEKKQVRTAIRNDESTTECEKVEKNVNEQEYSKKELEFSNAGSIIPSQESDASEPDNLFDILQDDMDPFSLLDLTEDSDLVEKQN